MEYPDIFDGKVRMTKKKMKSLVQRGLVVPAFSEREYTRHPKPDQPNYTVDVSAPVRNRNAGQVVDYLKLSEALKYDLVSSEDAKVLLTIESVRPEGQRDSHIARLVKCILDEEKDEIKKRLSWAKKQK